MNKKTQVCAFIEARMAAKGIAALAHGDLGRITAFVRRTLRHDPTVAGRKG